MVDLNKYMVGWEIDELIGQGAYGKVYRIKKNELGYNYFAALKVIKIPSDEKETLNLNSMGMNSNSLRAYYEETAREISKEIRIMESLKSANNIVHIEEHLLIPDADRLGWTILIRMELLESIRDYQLRMGPPDLNEVIKIGKDLCAALECCEGKNIVHRDIKPDNVFRNEFGMYKLGDFGIARKLENSKAVYSRKGTMSYIAPEVVKGNVYDNTVDIYSLGLMLYIYLNRQRPPFVDAYSQNITANALEAGQWRRINGEMLPAPVDAPVSLANIILTACNPNPICRYRSAGDFRRALEKWERTNLVSESGVDDTVVLGTGKAGDYHKKSRYDSDTLLIDEEPYYKPESKYNKKHIGMMIGLIAILSLSVAGGILYVVNRSPAHSQETDNNTPVEVQEQQETEPAAASEENKAVIIEKYMGLDEETALSSIDESIQCRVMDMYTDKKIEPGYIVAQYPAAGSELQTAYEGLTLYASRGNLSNNLGYYLKSDVYEIQLKKGEKKTLTLMINAVEEIEGTMAVDEVEGLEITFLEWEGMSKVKVEIKCVDDFYKGGIIQFYFWDDEDESSGSYCNVYYSIK